MTKFSNIIIGASLASFLSFSALAADATAPVLTPEAPQMRSNTPVDAAITTTPIVAEQPNCDSVCTKVCSDQDAKKASDAKTAFDMLVSGNQFQSMIEAKNNKDIDKLTASFVDGLSVVIKNGKLIEGKGNFKNYLVEKFAGDIQKSQYTFKNNKFIDVAPNVALGIGTYLVTNEDTKSEETLQFTSLLRFEDSAWKIYSLQMTPVIEENKATSSSSSSGSFTTLLVAIVSLVAGVFAGRAMHKKEQ
jgi:ketosteroid isomerase-like protein